MSRRWWAVTFAMLFVAVPAFPCGGPGADIIDRPLVSADRYLASILHDDELEAVLRPEFRFLEPFRRVMPDSVADLYEWAYSSGVGVYAPTSDDSVRRRREREVLAPVLERLGRGAYADVVGAARRVVDAVLDQPAAPAQAFGDALRTAVELVDVAPRLAAADQAIALRYFEADDSTRSALGAAGVLPPVLREALMIRALPRDSAGAYADAHPTSPRVASLRFVALQQAMRTGIPDGYAAELRDSVPPARWAVLERLHDDWLRQYGTHPMADYVRLSKERLFYFKGDYDRAWSELLAMYPRHRQRVLGEMRYLVYVGVPAPQLDDSRLDWPLRAALVTESPVSVEQWNRYWLATESHTREPWALAMQERLLWRAIDLADPSHVLPAAFPTRAMAPTPAWAGLRLIALLRAGDIAAAFAQADSTADSTVDVRAVRARLHLMRREWGNAIATLGENDPSTSYLIRVVAPRAVVDSLAGARSPFSAEARLTKAASLAAAGDWRGASRVVSGIGAARERVWSRTAALAGDTSRAGTLAFARWMREQRGQLFFGENTEWMRALNWRRYRIDPNGGSATDRKRAVDARLPWTAEEERDRIAAHLRATTELYYALRVYAKWLDGASASTPGLAATVREADQVYNRLVNWDANNSPYWGETLETSPEARAIRRAGSLLRRR